MPALEALLERGKANGVLGLKIISGNEVRAIEPNITDEVVAALYAPTGGIVCPFSLRLRWRRMRQIMEFHFNV